MRQGPPAKENNKPSITRAYKQKTPHPISAAKDVFGTSAQMFIAFYRYSTVYVANHSQRSWARRSARAGTQRGNTRAPRNRLAAPPQREREQIGCRIQRAAHIARHRLAARGERRR